MPKLIPHRPKDVVRKLQKLGYQIDRQKGSHVIMYNSKNKKRAVVPMHTKELKKGTLRSILRGCDISVDKFLTIK